MSPFRRLPLEFFVQRFQALEVGRARLLRRLEGAAPLEQGHQREDVVEVALGQFGNVAAAARLQGDQAFGSQHLERLAQGRAADAVLLGQGLLVDPGARLQFVREDALAQALGDFQVEGGLGNAAWAHCLICRPGDCVYTYCIHNYGYSIM
jgi:hypothetical protein